MGRYDGQAVLVVGLGLSGSSAVRYLVREGARVTATDSRAEPAGLAELRRQCPQAQFVTGGLAAPEPLSQYRVAVLSPGIALDEPFVRQLQAAGVELAGDIELFARVANAPVIGITGSNGKSTTTTLVGEMARAAGLKAGVGGNLGTPALDLLDPSAQLYVLELSSFQLETTRSLRCIAATVLNLSQDHLDRHGTMAHYGALKARVYEGCGTAVANREAGTRDSGLPTVGTRDSGLGTREQRWVSFGLDAPRQPGDYGVIDHEGEPWLAVFPSPESRVPSPVCPVCPVFPTRDLHIYGSHNWANALAALALADAAGIPREASLRALREFGGLPHRCQFVREIDGVQYFNDSKGTNVGSTLAALNGLPAPIVWLGGGQGKGQSFSELREPLARKGRAAVLFGEDAARIETDVFGALPVYREADMQAALQRARTLAEPGDRVLLSPACASFDQFESYVDRGNQFIAAVERKS